eukprot:GHUV01005863.1.p1 GENE.GHUV01005863.1~~GHUV01005863.1.p1  ORF type:complete len:373 (+),score=114.70 GHUV01005863.1:591-1709(+)
MAATEDCNAAAYNAFAWFLNVSTSVLIVFVNKLLMDPKKGYAFTFATTLCAFHFLSAAFCVKLSQWIGWSQAAPLPWRTTLYFALVANVSIASLNLSLLVNSVGFYQIAKLLIIPFVCVVELFWMKRRFTAPVVASILVVVTGVAIVTVTDISIKALGLCVAAVSVVSSGMQQILCGTIQRSHKLQSHQLLANTAPVQGVMLLAVGPLIDKAVSGNWVGQYALTTGGLSVLLLSCAISVAVNISQFMCLGRFSAVTFQVLGHTKTVLVLLTSWGVLHEHMSARKLSGMLLAVAGMVAYGYFNSSSSSSNNSSGKAMSDKAGQETLPLLNRSSKSAQDLPTVVTVGLKNATAEKRLTAVPSTGSMTQITVVAR